jgi:hypothetical protein
VHVLFIYSLVGKSKGGMVSMHRSFLSLMVAAATRTGWALVTTVPGEEGENDVAVGYVVLVLFVVICSYIYG